MTIESTHHLTKEELEAGLEVVRDAPQNLGVLEMIVRRPDVEQREVVDEAELDLAEGLLGDNWGARGSGSMPDGSADPERQLTIMSSRAVALVARERSRWALAGDQLYIDLDLSESNTPPGTRLSIGDAIVEVTAPPHLGCAKFVARFGKAAMILVNSEVGKELHLRGLNARVVKPGRIRIGDSVVKM